MAGRAEEGLLVRQALCVPRAASHAAAFLPAPCCPACLPAFLPALKPAAPLSPSIHRLVLRAHHSTPTTPHRYVVLAPTDSHQVTLLETTAADKKLEELPAYAALLKKFSQKEVGGAGVGVGGHTKARRAQAHGFVFVKICQIPPMARHAQRRQLLASAVGAWFPRLHHLLRFPCRQVLWWKHVDTEYAAEVAAQEEVFGGDEGKQRQEGAHRGGHRGAGWLGRAGREGPGQRVPLRNA